MNIEQRLTRLEEAVFENTTVSYNRCSPIDVAVFALWDEDRAMRLTDNFFLYEFACNDGSNVVLVHPTLLRALEDIRKHFGGKTVTVNSGYRTPTYNKRVGGGSESTHLLGMAADIVVEGVAPSKVAAYADNALQCGGVGRYKNFTHVDVYGHNRRW